jgi:acyl carrier protein
MRREEIERQVAEILALCLKRPVDPAETVVRESEDSWDSLAHVEILLGLQDVFELRLDPDEMQKLADSRQIVDAVLANGRG